MWQWSSRTGWQLVPINGTSPPARGWHGCAVHGHLVYIFGGNRWVPRPATSIVAHVSRPQIERQAFNDLWVLDTTAWTWTLVQPRSDQLPVARSAAGLACLDECLLLFGGKSSSRYLNDTWCFMHKDQQWHEAKLSPAPAPRALPTFASTRHGVIAYGGSSEDDTPLADLWLLKSAAPRAPGAPPALSWHNCRKEPKCLFVASSSHSESVTIGHIAHCSCVVAGRHLVVWGGCIGKVEQRRWSLLGAVKSEPPQPSGHVFCLDLDNPNAQWQMILDQAIAPAEGDPVERQPPRKWAAMAELEPGKLVLHGGIANKEIYSTPAVLVLSPPAAATPAAPAEPAGGSVASTDLIDFESSDPPQTPDLIDFQDAESTPDTALSSGRVATPADAATVAAAKQVERSTSAAAPAAAAADAKPAAAPTASPRASRLAAKLPPTTVPPRTSVLTSMTDALRSTVTPLSSAAQSMLQRVAAFESAQSADKAERSPPEARGGAAGPLGQLRYGGRDGRDAARPLGPGSAASAGDAPGGMDLAAWRSSLGSPPPSSPAITVLVPMKDPFAAPRPRPRTPRQLLARASAPPAITAPRSRHVANPTQPVVPGSGSDSEPTSPVSDWIRSASIAQETASAAGRAWQSARLPEVGLTEDDEVADLVAAMVAAEDRRAPYGDAADADTTTDAFQFAEVPPQLRMGAVQGNTAWPPAASPRHVQRGRFRETGSWAPAPQQDMQRQNSDSFDACNVSNMLLSDPLHALGMRLLSARATTLEFVSMEEARETVGEVARTWLQSVPSAECLRVKDVEALLIEYRRFAHLALLPRAPPRLGGLAHLTLQELRVRDVQTMLTEYKTLSAMAASKA